MNGEQRTIYDELGTPDPHARLTDPESSELTLRSLGKDTSYNWRIFERVVALSYGHKHPSGWPTHASPVTDDMILESMERVYGRRYQRNVIARQRGIIRELGWIERVDDVDSHVTGRPVVAHIPTEAGLGIWRTRTDDPAT